MLSLLLSILVLITGYFTYGRYVARFFGANDKRPTPALKNPDGVDFAPMPTWKVYTIEFLNIAGLGPIFGAVLGAMYGPMAYLWIVFGCIFMGAVHDFFSGMLSVRNNGASIPEIVGKYLGDGFRQFLRIFSLLLLLFVGVVFVSGPAGLLTSMSGGGKLYWLYGIFAYYLIATLLPINKIIGKIYPFFGAALLIMAIGVFVAMIYYSFDGTFEIKELEINALRNLHHNPGNNILFPMMFIVISCGALSGFHSTQAPMMARTIKKESYGQKVFYGAMITEGIVALIWATAAMNYFGGTDKLNSALAIPEHNPAWVVNEICNTWFGKVGAVIAVIGVIAAPITTGDTAFRSARLTVADIFNVKQSDIKKRLLISLPLFAVGFLLSRFDFSILWKYLGISNQILAALVLWTAAMYLSKVGKAHWMLSIPAVFITTVCFSYLLVAPYNSGGVALDKSVGLPIGLALGVASLILFLLRTNKRTDTKRKA